MNDTIEMRIRSAAAAAWWTLLIGMAFLFVQWILYLVLMSSRPGWLLSLWGPNLGWENYEPDMALGSGSFESLSGC